MGRPRLTPEQQEASRIRRKEKQQAAQRKRRMQQGEQKTDVEAFDAFCHAQQMRILRMIHDCDGHHDNAQMTRQSDPERWIDTNVPGEYLWARQRYMALGPALRSTEEVDCEVRK